MKTFKNYIFRISVFLFLFLFVSNAGFSQNAKYVFFFIGDGMGLAHVAATEAYLAASQGVKGFEELSFSEFPVTGFSTTYAGNRFITGSAAAGTALATGHKTTINTISMDAEKSHPLESIAEKAKKAGMKVGIISSVSIDHATPACFYAHQPERSMYYEIAMQLPESGFDFFGGGGFKDHTNSGSDISAYVHASQVGYTVTSTIDAFNGLKPGIQQVMAVGSVIEPSGALRYAIDQDETDIPLEDFVAKAIELLENPDGFFIMCEEGKIDWASHENDGVTVIHNVISLSKSVDEALDFYNRHPGETLIVVTADHETGGLTMGHSLTKYGTNYHLLGQQKVSAQQFTMIADSLFEIEQNQNFGFAMQMVEDYFGLGGASGIELSEYEENLLYEAYLYAIGEKDLKSNEAYLRYGGYYPLAATALRILNNKAGMAWTTWSHTGVPVPVYAIGAGQELFDGYYDNTDIPKKIMQAMGLEMESN